MVHRFTEAEVELVLGKMDRMDYSPEWMRMWVEQVVAAGLEELRGNRAEEDNENEEEEEVKEALRELQEELS